MPDKTMKILLVEDNDLDIVMVQRLMMQLSLDYPIIRAANGEEALAILRPANADPVLLPPFIILLDISMPRMNQLKTMLALESQSAEQTLTASQPQAAARNLGPSSPQSVAAHHDDALFHDLNGPLVNAKGFSTEAVEVLSILQSMIENNAHGLDNTQVESIRELLSEDLSPCLDRLFQSISKLEKQLQRHEALRACSAGSGPL